MTDNEALLVIACLHAVHERKRVKELISLLNKDRERARSEHRFVLHDDKHLWWVDTEK